MPKRPFPPVRCIVRQLLGPCVAVLAPAVCAEPFQVEVLVFERPADAAVPPVAPDYRPGCLGRATPPTPSAGTPGAPTLVGPDDFRLATEARALRRSSTGLQLLFQTAWQQDLPAGAAGPWVRIAGPPGTGLVGCLRVKLAQVPEVAIQLVHDGSTGERYALSGTARVLPGNVHYFDHPSLGALVRLDALEPPADDADMAPATAEPAVTAAPTVAPPPPPPPPASPAQALRYAPTPTPPPPAPAAVAPATPPVAAPPSAPQPTVTPDTTLPPPPKKPFRW